MADRDTGVPAGIAAVEVISQRRRRSRAPLRLLGTALLAYGVAGLVVLGLIGSSLAAPIEELGKVADSVEEQRAAVLDSLGRASETIDRTAEGVRGMDISLAEAQAATDRSSAIAQGLAASMSQLSDAMGLTIFGVQPLVGLQPGFAGTASQLGLLATDLATIGQALQANRADATTVAASLDELSDSLERLTTAVEGGPRLEVVGQSVEGVRVGVLALVVWLGLLALGSIGAGIGCWWAAGRS